MKRRSRTGLQKQQLKEEETEEGEEDKKNWITEVADGGRGDRGR